MYEWLLIVILAYLLFGLASLGDKLVLAGKPDPNSYTFYIGLFGLYAVLFFPFVGFSIPSFTIMALIIIDALVRFLGTYSAFYALEHFEVSKVIPTIGGTQPIFILLLTWAVWGFLPISLLDIIAFILLILGSIIISDGHGKKTKGRYLKITLFSSFMFSLDYILLKIIFTDMPFLRGVAWIGLFVFMFTLLLLIRKKSRKEILSKDITGDKKVRNIFLGTQLCGGVATLLNFFAISLAPIAFLPILNSLKGIQYGFLFILTIFFTVFFPKILKEEISKKIIIRKISSLIMIAIGLSLIIIN